jgi:hypothetical protein
VDLFVNCAVHRPLERGAEGVAQVRAEGVGPALEGRVEVHVGEVK